MRREYVVRERRVDDYIYYVTASSKKEAIRMVDECEVDYKDVWYHNSYKPVLVSINEYDDCPNKGEGWTEIPLDELNGYKKIGGFRWHYNGKCGGEKAAEGTHCINCRASMEKGYRLLTNEEKQYLNDTYLTRFNVEVNV
tara:strand:- start:561 stop:980 length:420 start_codon:yes stop_codon:yes gene_type:complete